jgi:hypothetical protein
MAGIIPESVMTVTLDGFDETGSPQYYRLVSFPSKVNVTSVQLIVNGECRGTPADGRVWLLGCVKGRQSDQTIGGADPEDEDTIEFFGSNPKPTVDGADGKYVSNVVTPIQKPIVGDTEWSVSNSGTYAGLVSQMDPDEFLMLYIATDGGDFTGLDTALTAATIVIGYEGCGSNL